MKKICLISWLFIGVAALFCMISQMTFAASKAIVLPLDGKMYVLPSGGTITPPPPPPPPPGVPTVTSAGQIWMDRNLGASQVATSNNGIAAYGDLYQWGRDTDGHEKRTSSTTSTNSTSNTPGHGSFIMEGSDPWDWRTPQYDFLWQGVSGINNPCPSGFRLPTYTELEIERSSWSSNNSAGAFASPLKLVKAGDRNDADGIIGSVGDAGSYWSMTLDPNKSNRGSILIFFSNTATMSAGTRATGISVRCFKD